MLAVGIFIAFWVVVALGLFLIASRGGRPRIGRGATRGATRSALLLFVVTTAVFGIALPILMATGNHSNANAQVSGARLTSAERSGRELFGQHCGVCHTLSAANAVGKVGPDLDVLRPDAGTVLRTIQNGCLPNPPSSDSQEICLGQGVMPADVVTGVRAEQVAQFVARVTGASTTISSSGSSASSSAAPTTSTSSASSSSATSTTSTSASSSSAAPSGPAQTINVAAAPSGALKFTTSKLTAKAGKITFVFANKSPLPHNLTIQQGTNGKVLGATPTFTGGSRSFTVTLPAGTYTYFCSVPGHRQAGMLGTLTVT